MRPSSSCAVGVMARVPSAAGKSRLARDLAPARLLALRAAMLADTLDVVARARDLQSVDVVVFYTPADAVAEIATLAGAFDLAPQREGDLGSRMRGALAHLFDRGFGSAMVVGTDIPLLAVEQIVAARDVLASTGGVVVGPADDGGYFLIGMTALHGALFEGIEWGTSSVLTDTLRQAEHIGVETTLLGSCYDIDTIEDLRRLERELVAVPAHVARHTRSWF